MSDNSSSHCCSDSESDASSYHCSNEHEQINDKDIHTVMTCRHVDIGGQTYKPFNKTNVRIKFCETQLSITWNNGITIALINQLFNNCHAIYRTSYGIACTNILFYVYLFCIVRSKQTIAYTSKKYY